ncbi:MAG: PilZ domain-containing protein [Gammaproteobacteria bacterium]
MLTHDERRDFIRMDVNCEITYKLADSDDTKTGLCTTLSGAGLSFLADQPFEIGLAMEVNIAPKSSITPPMAAYVEIVRCSKRTDSEFEIAAVIKSIKGS